LFAIAERNNIPFTTNDKLILASSFLAQGLNSSEIAPAPGIKSPPRSTRDTTVTNASPALDATRLGIDLHNRLADIQDVKNLNPNQKSKLSEHFRNAAGIKPEFDKLVSEVAAKTGSYEYRSPLKEVDRSVEKVAGKYRGNEKKLNDVVRSTLVADDYTASRMTADSLREEIHARYGKEANVRVYDSIDHKSESSNLPRGAYRDIKVYAKINGHTTEIQINTPEMMQAKRLETPVYERKRTIEERAKTESRDLTQAEFAEVAELKRRAEKIYNEAIDKIEEKQRKKGAVN
jgi:hypothetical protein